MTQDSHDEKRRKHMAVMDDKRAGWKSEAMHQNRLLHDALTRAETAEAKLAKAVAAIRVMMDEAEYPDEVWKIGSAVLAELEKTK